MKALLAATALSVCIAGMPATAFSDSSLPLLHHPVGDTIDAAEASRYGLFSEIPGFQSALLAPGGKKKAVELHVVTRQGTNSRTDTLLIPSHLLLLLSDCLHGLDAEQDGEPEVVSFECRVEMRSGHLVTGRLTRWNGPEIVVTNPYGTSTLPIEEIHTLSYEQHVGPGGPGTTRLLRKADPNRTRLLFMPTGRSLEHGEGYFGVYEVVMPAVQVGVGRKVSLGGGFFPFTDGEVLFGWLTGQAGLVEQERFALAAGTIALLVTGEDEDFSAGIVYGIGSYGTSDRSIILGAGYGYADGRMADKPMITLGGQRRIGRSTKLLSENWLLPGIDWPVLSLGIRWFAESLSADFALVRPMDPKFTFLGIPYVDFVWHF
ncbi:hypothetical protein GF324_12335 [bacterium]|nr:hypothetical protein [bacterium]